MKSAAKLRRQRWGRSGARVRQQRRERYNAVLEKARIETYGDVFDLYYGLPAAARENAGALYISRFIGASVSPREVVEILTLPKVETGVSHES